MNVQNPGLADKADSGEPLVPIPEELLETLQKLIEQAKSDPSSLSQIKTVLKYSAYRGPYPPAEIIEEFERALPGSGKQLLEWTNAQIEHRHRQESLQVEGMENRMDWGQRFGFGLGVISIAAGAAVALVTNSWAGAIA